MDTVQWTEPELRIASLGQIPVEGATAEIILAYLPSRARRDETLNFWLDFKNTSSVPVSIRPVIYLWVGHTGKAFSARELEPGQSYSEKYGAYWQAAVLGMGLDIDRIEAAIEVYTPEGWVEADRAVGELFRWTSDLPLPEVRNVRAPESADPGQKITIPFDIYNPGYTNPPSSWFKVNGQWVPPLRPPLFAEWWWWHPPNTSLSFFYSFTMGSKDMTITIIPYRWADPGYTVYPGEPVSVTVRSTVAIPRYTLAVTINGNGIVEPMSGEFEEGTVVELTAFPADGWWFHSWEGTDNNAINPTTVTIDSDKQVVCNFTQVAPVGCLPVVGAGILLIGIIALIIALI